ncbi:MAG: DUF2339 domain-containing protein [Azoarcus sp.]|jgi:uncharacterized membrane protein|nr:DUF2339 domain-containing protein [Azoarcus sp.]
MKFFSTVLFILLAIGWFRISTLKKDNQRLKEWLSALSRRLHALEKRVDESESLPHGQKTGAAADAPAAAPAPQRREEKEETLLLHTDVRPDEPQTPATGAEAALPAAPPAAPPTVAPAPPPVAARAEAETEAVSVSFDWSGAGDEIPVPAAMEKSTPIPPAPPPRPAGPTFAERAFAAAKDWLLGGNTVLRVGVALLFLGFAFLLRYASDRFSPPVELRYIGVAIAAIGLLALGWRLRLKRPAYGLMLQGAGVAVLYLTSFAAMRLHFLLPPGLAFGLLVFLTIAAVMLAVLQDALGLACAAVFGGFAAPILTSTGSGDHVALFSYFALLNGGVALIAWFKAWRVLNLIGFTGTFGIGFAWGIRSYTADLFMSTEPFLILFFLMYVCIGLLFARRKLMEAADAPESEGRRAMSRWSARRADYLDGTMVFGPPLIGFGLQCTLIHPLAPEFGMAFSALGLGAFYLLMALFLRGRRRVGLLMEICAALALVFGTLAIPLAFEARWTAMVWAAEGAGIYWLSLMQGRRLARGFSLALIALAAAAWLRDSGIGAETLLEASPLGAAMLGVSLLFCHRALRRAPEEALGGGERRALPLLAASGLIFLYLIAPSCFGLEYTVIAWALAGMATVFAGLRLGSRPFLACAFGVQFLGAAAWLRDSGIGTETLLEASPLGAAMLGASLLFCHRALRRAPEEALGGGERRALPLLAASGLIFLYLIAPSCFGLEYTVIAWALAGMATVFAGLRLGSRLFLICAFGVQFLGGLLFLCNLRLDTGDGGVLASGWMGLLCAASTGFTLIASAILAQSDAMARKDEALARRVGIALLLGLVFVNLAALFVLDWNEAGIAWAASGLLILWLGLWQGQRGTFYFGVALEAVAGCTFMLQHAASIPASSPSGHWASVALALAAMAGAWRIHHVAARGAAAFPALDPQRLLHLSSLLLAWGAGWWTWTVADQMGALAAHGVGFDGRSELAFTQDHLILLALSLSALLWMTIARIARWRAMALAVFLPHAAAICLLAKHGLPWSALAGPVWIAFFAVHFALLRGLAHLWPAAVRSAAHVLGAWLMVGALALAAHSAVEEAATRLSANAEPWRAVSELTVMTSTWRWLSWALAPCLYLWLASGARRWRIWPFRDFTREYRFYAALPLALATLSWFWITNTFSCGVFVPHSPHVPVLNPLELCLLFALLICWRWSRLPEPELQRARGAAAAMMGVSLLAFITLAACRMAYFWGGLPFDFRSMTGSMSVQMGWSLIWSLFALALMIRGCRQGHRRAWMAGATLLGIVVVKLFFVELGDSGGLERIVSFIGVGALLLIVGYFAPLPPKLPAREAGERP